jgi:hypothetical protein
LCVPPAYPSLGIPVLEGLIWASSKFISHPQFNTVYLDGQTLAPPHPQDSSDAHCSDPDVSDMMMNVVFIMPLISSKPLQWLHLHPFEHSYWFMNHLSHINSRIKDSGSDIDCPPI